MCSYSPCHTPHAESPTCASSTLEGQIVCHVSGVMRICVWRRVSIACIIEFGPFLSRVSILTRDIDIANMSVRLSVCWSVRNVPVSDENGLTYCHSFSPYGSTIILVLPASNIFTKFRRGPPLPGR